MPNGSPRPIRSPSCDRTSSASPASTATSPGAAGQRPSRSRCAQASGFAISITSPQGARSEHPAGLQLGGGRCWSSGRTSWASVSSSRAPGSSTALFGRTSQVRPVRTLRSSSSLPTSSPGWRRACSWSGSTAASTYRRTSTPPTCRRWPSVPPPTRRPSSSRWAPPRRSPTTLDGIVADSSASGVRAPRGHPGRGLARPRRPRPASRLTSAAGELRVPDLALASLRGADRRRTWLLALSEPLLLVALAVPLGVAGRARPSPWALVRAWLPAGLPVPVPAYAVLASVAVVACAIAVCVVSTRAVLARSLADQLSGQARPRPAGRLAVLVALALVALTLVLVVAALTRPAGGATDAADLGAAAADRRRHGARRCRPAPARPHGRARRPARGVGFLAVRPSRAARSAPSSCSP